MNERADWKQCKNILCIRPDNMGDLIMTSPALRALKETFNCRITILTSHAGSAIAPFIPSIDDVLIAEVPWVKNNGGLDGSGLTDLVERIKTYHFDGAIIFTVYSQSPLPSAMLAFLAGIPLRLAYCHENPYELLSHWISDEEPFNFIRHQVQRDLQLVASIAASVSDDHLDIVIKNDPLQTLYELLPGIEEKGWVIFHPGVSEEKRMYPVHLWIELGCMIAKHLKKIIVITGSSSEKNLCETIKKGIEASIDLPVINAAGMFALEMLITAIRETDLIVSVNTAAVHIAAAVQTPVIVLYALTNPQHTPWKVQSKVFPFPVSKTLQSRNSIINFVNKHFFDKEISYPQPIEIFYAVRKMLSKTNTALFEKKSSILNVNS